jgi:hypothetical protein
MAQQSAAAEAEARTVVLGVRLSTGLRTEIKVEAARRNITIAELFDEMWRGYLDRQTHASKH